MIVKDFQSILSSRQAFGLRWKKQRRKEARPYRFKGAGAGGPERQRDPVAQWEVGGISSRPGTFMAKGRQL